MHQLYEQCETLTMQNYKYIFNNTSIGSVMMVEMMAPSSCININQLQPTSTNFYRFFCNLLYLVISLLITLVVSPEPFLYQSRALQKDLVPLW